MSNTSTSSKYTRLKNLNLQLLSLGRTPHVFVRVTGELREEAMPGLTQQSTAKVAVIPVVNLETGEDMVMLGLSMVVSALEHMPDGYVGHCFEILNSPPKEGKAYSDVGVWEIACE